jgi:pSer/pThr/pTyr-binding forkhead associated (FHA) protein
MDVRLVIEHGKTRKRTFHFRNEEGVIGRQRGCTVRIPSPEVSRRHCVLRVQNGYVTVEDLNSSNGTLLNGEEVSGSQVVRPGDRLRIGPVTFIVEYQLTPEAIDRLLRGEDGSGFEVIEEGVGEPELVAAEADVVAEEADLVAEELVAEEEEVPLEVADELEPIDAGEFQLPQSEDLRDILSGLDEDSKEVEPYEDV